MNSLRILLASSSSGSHGGGELYLIGLAQGLAGLGHTVETALSDHPRMDELARQCSSFGEVIRLPYLNTYDRVLRCAGAVMATPTIARLKKYFRHASPDLIHVNKQNVEDGLDLLMAASRTGIPTVATVHIARGMSQLKARAGGLRDWLSTSVLCRCRAHYITVAEFCSDQLLACCGDLDPDRVHSVWNGVSPAPAADRAAIRSEWDCREDNIVLGCIARLEQQKNPLFAVDLLRKLPSHVHLVWVGDGRLREDFLRRVEHHGLRDRVHVDGWRSDARLRLAGFDIFVLPSLYEGFPFAVLEAMAASLPCVVSDVDGTREALIDHETGCLCPSGELDAWVDRLQGLILDGQLRHRMGQSGLERIANHFSLESMARKTVEVYEKVLASASRSLVSSESRF